MVSLRIPQEEKKLKETLAAILDHEGYAVEDSPAQGGVVNIVKKNVSIPASSLGHYIKELEKFLYNEKKGVLYRSLLEIVEKPIIESVLERTEGNQLKAAKILGLNRNTIRAKIKKLGINPDSFK